MTGQFQMRNIFSRKRNYLLWLIVLLVSTTGFSKLDNRKEFKGNEEARLYNELHLAQLGLSDEIFSRALQGWKTMNEKYYLENPGVLSIADLSQSSNLKRLYVIDLAEKKVLFNTYVAHGRNSGDEFAKSFSNRPESYMSSLGFYITENTYEGLHGLSLKLNGVENGINDIAMQRGIVMHGAPYVSKSFIERYGRLGRSQGCPAVPEELCSPIVNSIKGGSCFFMYYPDCSYFSKSELF